MYLIDISVVCPEGNKQIWRGPAYIFKDDLHDLRLEFIKSHSHF